MSLCVQKIDASLNLLQEKRKPRGKADRHLLHSFLPAFSPSYVCLPLNEDMQPATASVLDLSRTVLITEEKNNSYNSTGKAVCPLCLCPCAHVPLCLVPTTPPLLECVPHMADQTPNKWHLLVCLAWYSLCIQ